MAQQREWSQDDVCDLVRKYVKAKGWRNPRAAEEFGCHKDTVSRVINGTSPPTAPMLCAIGFEKTVHRVTEVVYRKKGKQ